MIKILAMLGETKIIAYLDLPRFELQNNFLFNMLGHLPDIEFKRLGF